MSKKILQLMDEEKDADEFNKTKEYEKKNFFKRFGITTEFLNDDPSNWENRVDYKENRKRIMCLKCVNESAERCVKLMKELTKIHKKGKSKTENAEGWG